MNTKKIKKIAESLDWTVTNLKDAGLTVEKGVTELEFSKYSPAGEDFSFTVSGKTERDIVSEIQEYANGFDAEDHVKMWLEAKNNNVGGVPSLKELVKDADDIKEMLEELSAALQDDRQPDKN